LELEAVMVCVPFVFNSLDEQLQSFDHFQNVRHVVDEVEGLDAFTEVCHKSTQAMRERLNVFIMKQVQKIRESEELNCNQIENKPVGSVLPSRCFHLPQTKNFEHKQWRTKNFRWITHVEPLSRRSKN
jgi:hypothetical protein